MLMQVDVGIADALSCSRERIGPLKWILQQQVEVLDLEVIVDDLLRISGSLN